MTPPDTPVLSLRDVTVTYAARDRTITALDACSLDIHTERVALLGPNGAGKSTLMAVIAGALRPDSGTISRHHDPRAIAMVFQTNALDELLTIRENLKLAAAIHQIDPPTIQTRIDTITKRLGIHDRLSDRVKTLSGGLKRRADLARAMLIEPDLLLLDEPTTGLDIDARRTLWNALISAHDQRPFAMLYATHLTDEAEHAHRVVLISEGKAAAQGPPADLKANLGTAVLRLKPRNPSSLDTLAQWTATRNLNAITLDDHVLAINATHNDVAAFDLPDTAITLAPPSLDDVYLWTTHANLAPEPAA